MKQEILSHLDNPGYLEKLYRSNKSIFKTEFNIIYPQLTDKTLASYWNERLNYESSEISWGSRSELVFVVFASLTAGLISKFPAIFNWNEELFFQRNIGFVVFPMLTTYFMWKKKFSFRKVIPAAFIFITSLLFINFFPSHNKSDTLLLSCIHLPVFMWSVLGYTYSENNLEAHHKRLDFLLYNGDLMIMTGLIVIAGGILTGVTLQLFHVTGLNIEKFYGDYVIVFGLSAAPIVGTYITQTNPQLVNKVSPVIARIFSPLVLVMLITYLIAIFFSGKDPYNDRNFLMIFNFLLIGVMAIILFSLAESFKKNEKRSGNYILLALSVVTIVVNGIALSAILFRISEWGFTPNRLAIMGANVLMLTHLLMITYRLFKNNSGKGNITEVENVISKFLPVYVVWTVVVVFIFPLVFQFQ